LGLFFKVFLGDMSIWAVLSGVLAYEVIRRGLDSQHAKRRHPVCDAEFCSRTGDALPRRAAGGLHPPVPQ